MQVHLKAKNPDQEEVCVWGGCEEKRQNRILWTEVDVKRVWRGRRVPDRRGESSRYELICVMRERLRPGDAMKIRVECFFTSLLLADP